MTGQRWASHLKYLRCEKWAPWSGQSHASTGGDNHAMMGWWFASDEWRSLDRNLLYFKFIYQEFHTVTCRSARRSQHLTLSTDKWYYIVQISLPVWTGEFSFKLSICTYIWCHTFASLLWNFIFRNLIASCNPALSTSRHTLQWSTGQKCNVRWTLQQLQHRTQLNTEAWNYA